jgi:hypothetical protein
VVSARISIGHLFHTATALGTLVEYFFASDEASAAAAGNDT